jgi:glycosyltransferase involved in cell wall biosynthesis
MVVFMEIQSKSKLRFLFVSSDKFPPFRVDVSILFGKELVERGHIIEWLLQSDETLHNAYQTEWSGCKVYVGPTDNGTSIGRRLRKNLYDIFHDFKMFRILQKSKYDFIIVKDKFISGLLAIIASKIHKVKFVYWLSFPVPEFYLYELREGTARYPLIYWIRGHFSRILLYRMIMPFSHHIFVQSEQMKRDITMEGISEEKMTSVPMGVSTKEILFFEYKAEQNRLNKKKIVLYLGTLTKARKMDFLIRVFEKVFRRKKNVQLHLVGGGEDPSDEQILKDEARRLKIEDRVLVTGFIPKQEAWAYVQEADVCVSPYYPTPILNSTSPTKLIEYMAMGKAVVANDHPEQRLVISESKAGICVPYKKNAFAEAILHLLNHPKEAKKMGIRGREYVEKNRDYEQIADLVEIKLLQVCNFEQKKITG